MASLSRFLNSYYGIFSYPVDECFFVASMAAISLAFVNCSARPKVPIASVKGGSNGGCSWFGKKLTAALFANSSGVVLRASRMLSDGSA